MDTALTFVLEIYRAAHDTPAEEFHSLLFRLLQQVIPFRSAAWCNNAGIDRHGYVIRGLQTYNEPDSLLEEMPNVNNKHSSEMERVAAHPGIALRRFTPHLYPKEATDIQEYIRRYGHEQNLLIADIAHPRGRGEWLSLFRPANEDHFSRQEQRLLTLLMPHLVEALTINRKLALVTAGEESPLNGTRALIKANGAVLHCGARFCELLGDAWAESRYTRLPSHLLSALQRNGKTMVARGTVLITASRLGDLLLLRAMKVSPLARLTERERTVVQLYARGSSYKEVARALGRSPTTIRNFIQHAYRKLGIDDKTALARLLQEES